MGENCCDCHQVSQGRHLGNLSFFLKNTLKTWLCDWCWLWTLMVWWPSELSAPRCQGQAKGSNERFQAGDQNLCRDWNWSQGSAERETESIAEKMPNQRSQVRKEESESQSLNCQPQSVMGMPGKKLGKAPGASDKFVWMMLCSPMRWGEESGRFWNIFCKSKVPF